MACAPFGARGDFVGSCSARLWLIRLSSAYAEIDVRLQRVASGGDAQAAFAEETAIRALTLYRGHFFADEEQRLWVIPYREHPRTHFLRLVELTGDRMAAGEPEEKSELWYRKARDIESTAEAIYRRLMRSLARRGQSSEAIDV